MKTSLELVAVFPLPPAVLYRAWLDSEEHSAMTGGAAVCSDHPGGSFTAWDGYISGKNISLRENEEIVQSWRTTDFTSADEDSTLTLRFRKVPGGCALTLLHSNIPEGQPDYEQGWKDHYLAPMRDHFS